MWSNDSSLFQRLDFYFLCTKAEINLVAARQFSHSFWSLVVWSCDRHSIRLDATP